MEAVTILRELWRRRATVGLVALAAILFGLVLTFRLELPPQSRQYEVGIATARVLVDTPQSQVIKVDPKGSETLGLRANVLANLMVEGEAKAAIARRAGLEPRRLLAIAESALEPQTVSKKALRNPKINLLTTRVVTNLDGEQLPIIEIEAQAPTAARAKTLANATVTGLSDYLEAKVAAGEEVDARRRLRVSGLGSAQATVSTRGPSPAVGVGVAIFVFLGGCAAILLASALVRGWRQAEAAEYTEASEYTDVDESTPDDFNLDLDALSLTLEPSEREREART
jgi:hypothetical protein